MIAFIIILCICLSGCQNAAGCKPEKGIYRNEQNIENGRLVYWMNIEEGKNSYKCTISKKKLSGDSVGSYLNETIQLSKQLDFNQRIIQKSDGISGQYVHEFQFENNQVRWRFVCIKDDTGKETGKDIEDEKFIILKHD